MGKIKIKTLGNEEEELKQKEEARIKKEEKIKREKAKGQADKATKESNVAEATGDQDTPPEKDTAKKNSKSKQKSNVKGKKYQAALKKIDKSKGYDLKTSVSLLKTIKYASFDETVEVHFNLKEQNIKGEVNLPHGTGKSVRVVIADEAVLEQVEKGIIDFDILLATPAMMPKLVKFARVLGPKGLMPNPKNGTVTPNPEEAMKKFSGGTVRFKSEPKFPLLHQAVGKSSFEDTKLVENVAALIKAVGKNNILQAYVSTSMSPSVKLDLDKI
ncbi:MAG TPA: hypothetical protein VK338_02430 [Candidatus Nitrosocosmicus sp.]|nr:hypothetical protein [Candidatus Nitrosocosmicus sp.]